MGWNYLCKPGMQSMSELRRAQSWDYPSRGRGHNYADSWFWASSDGSAVTNGPAMQERQVRSLAQEYPLEEKTATHSVILAWRIPWTQEPGGLQSLESQRIRHDWSNLAVEFKISILMTQISHYFSRELSARVHRDTYKTSWQLFPTIMRN